MRRVISIISVALVFGGILFAQEASVRNAAAAGEASAVETIRASRDSVRRGADGVPQRRKIDFRADVVRKGGGDSIIHFVGNFAAHHNGAVISCDSSVRYSDTRWGFFGRVIINQDSVYIYGDSALYDGESSLAEVYAPIVKVVDGDALLYTYNFSFNTAEKIGRYTGGGVLVHDDDIMESLRGYYYADTHEVICVDEVELHGADYDMKSDSVIYNSESDVARFFDNSEIWNSDGDYLCADEGLYDKAQDLYTVTRNGYVLTPERELWGDTLSYYRSRGHVVARRNIQMDDFENKMLAFGDFAEYWSEAGNAVLTRDPSVVGYDTEQGDSVFLRADSMLLFTVSRFEPADTADSLTADAPAAERSDIVRNETTPVRPTDATHNIAQSSDEDVDYYDEDDESADSVRRDSVAQPTAKELKALERDRIRKAKDSVKRVKAAVRKKRLDSIAVVRQAKATAQLERARAKELARAAKDSVKRAALRERMLRRGGDVSVLDSLDSLAAARSELLRHGHADGRDSVAAKEREDSIALAEARAMYEDSVPTAADTTRTDSIYRLVKAYRNVRMYRTDAQMACDSMVSVSTDSIIHLYIDPVLWNNSNQIASDEVDIFTRNRQIERAEFIGSPIMVSEIDSTYYNQVAGKVMIAYFRHNDIYRNDVNGNVQTIYFQREDEDLPEVTQMIYLESASASFYIEDKELVGMTYRNDVPFKLYPIAQIPPTQDMRLRNFKWVPSLRPTRESVFDRTIRPSVRDERRLRERPTFDIVERMDRYKERLLRSGEWIDREDELTPELVEWRNTREL